MSRYSDDDPYVDAGSGVLKNLLGIEGGSDLEQAEVRLVSIRSYRLLLSPLPGNFDLPHLQAIHRYLFGEIYSWAGEIRAVDIAKGGNLFAHHAHIVNVANDLLLNLANENHLARISREAFAHGSPNYFGELNALHPFREGNGRTLREFFTDLAHRREIRIAWSQIDRVMWLEASIASFKGDNSKLESLLEKAIAPTGNTPREREP